MPSPSVRSRKRPGRNQETESKGKAPADDELINLQSQFHFSGRKKRASGKTPSPPPPSATSETLVTPTLKKPTTKLRKTAIKRKQKSSKNVPNKKARPAARKDPTVIFRDDDDFSESSDELENSSESDNDWSQPSTSQLPGGKDDSDGEYDDIPVDEIPDDDIPLSESKTIYRKKQKSKERAVALVVDEDDEFEDDESFTSATTNQTAKEESEWTDVELTGLISGLDDIRKKGGYLGLYGLNEKQASLIHKKYVPTKSLRQIKTAVFASVNEHTLTTHRLPIDAWNELFEALYPENVLKTSNEALSNFLMDKANEHEGQRRQAERNANSSSNAGTTVTQCKVNFSEIYSFLASIVSNKEDQPPMSAESTTCLLNAIENIEKQADIVASKELDDELNSRYCALLLNRRNMRSLMKNQAVFSEENGAFDAINPLALNLQKWNLHFRTELGKHKNLIFNDFVDESVVDES